MNELLKVNYDNQMLLHCQLRELLHEFLKNTNIFQTIGFLECVNSHEIKDFMKLKNEQVRLEGNRQVKRTVQDYEITLDMEKKLNDPKVIKERS